jgi:prepilin-type N-terminal cleavage/methylation domain-containing protein
VALNKIILKRLPLPSNRDRNDIVCMKSGFTLVEMLIVVGIGVMMAVVAISLYGTLQVSSQLNENAAQIIQALRTARERSIAGLNNKPYGVNLIINPNGADSYILYQGTSYTSRIQTYDQTQVLDSALSLSISGLIQGGNNVDINFSLYSGTPNNPTSGIGTITLTHSSQGSRSITINTLGTIEQN